VSTAKPFRVTDVTFRVCLLDIDLVAYRLGERR